MHHFDISIIGGGICALSFAWEALRNGKTVALSWTPRKDSATHAAGGMLTPCAEAGSADEHLIDFAVESCRIYPNWIQTIQTKSQIQVDYDRSGSLLLALKRDHLKELTHLEGFHKSLGLQTERLSIQKIRSLEPYISPKISGGLFAKDDHRVNPRLLQAALIKGIKQLGGMLIPSEKTSLMMSGNRTSGIVTQKNNVESYIKSRIVVAADGVWTTQQPQLNDVPPRPVKGQYIIAKGNPLIMRTVRTPDIYLVPRKCGELYIGASVDESGLDNRKKIGRILDLLFHAWQAVRGIYELELIETAVGFRPALRDNKPAIGRSPIDGLFLNIGHFRHGIMLAPIAAKHLMQIIQNENKESQFNPMRLWE